MSEAGWYADPLQRAELRWYHGAGWGEQVRTGGTEGVDPIDAAGRPMWAAPLWPTAPYAPAVAPLTPAPEPPARAAGMGRGTKVALWLVVVAFVVLIVVAVGAVLVLIRNTPRLTGADIERQVGAAMSRQVGGPVTVDCPPVLYTGGSDGTVECTASGPDIDTVAYVEVVVRDARVLRWQVVATGSDAAADEPA